MQMCIKRTLAFSLPAISVKNQSFEIRLFTGYFKQLKREKGPNHPTTIKADRGSCVPFDKLFMSLLSEGVLRQQLTDHDGNAPIQGTAPAGRFSNPGSGELSRHNI